MELEYQVQFEEATTEETPRLCSPLPTTVQADGTARTPIDYGEGEWRAAVMKTCPAYAQVPPSLLRRRERLRVLFLYEELTYARQCAAMLCSIAHEGSGLPDDDPLMELAGRLCPQQTGVALLSASLGILDEKDGESRSEFLDRVDALLLYSEGDVEISYQKLHCFLETATGRDQFIALKKENCPASFVENLQFEHDFILCPVGRNDEAYQEALFRAAAEDEGVTLAPAVDVAAVLRQLKAVRRERFEETDFRRLLQRCRRRFGLCLDTRHLLLEPYSGRGHGAREELRAMVGRESMKEEVARILALRLYQQRRRCQGAPVADTYCHMAFSGPPGTGKSETARLIARILQEEGGGSGAFVEVGREGLIGSYLGHTSLKVEKLFEQARGGVLFIDEAGALISRDRDRDIYAEEAVNALVRHMELSPETTVIFATYEREMEQLLSSNPGLRSRIAKVLPFDAYGPETLWEILLHLGRKRGLAMESQAREMVLDYFCLLRQRTGGSFGNGREARRLLEAAMEELALRVVSGGETAEDRVTAEDLRRAIQRLTPPEKAAKVIGF